jgi:hypothetical protein
VRGALGAQGLRDSILRIVWCTLYRAKPREYANAFAFSSGNY